MATEFTAFLKNSFAGLHKMHDTTLREHAGLSRDIAPNASGFFTEETRPLDKGEIVDLEGGEGRFTIVLIGVATYTDGFKGDYETEFCSFFVGRDPKVWHSCDTHNTIK